MTKFKFEDLSKKTVAQLRKIAEGVDHELLQDPAKLPKEELLAALCQALGIEAGESPEKTVQGKGPATQEDAASESAPAESSEDEEPVSEESESTESPKESAKDESVAVQEDTATSEPAPEVTEEDKPATKQSAQEKKASVQESTPPESPEVLSKEKSKLKVQIRELKSQRKAALEAHDHVQLKSIRRRIRTLKRKVRRIAV